VAPALALKPVEPETDFLKLEILRGRWMDPCVSDVKISSALATNIFFFFDGGWNGGSLNLKIRRVQVLILSTGSIVVVRRNCMSEPEDLIGNGACLFAWVYRSRGWT
jgi:hypothetical protein